MSTVRSRATDLHSNDDERGGMMAVFDSSYSERGAGLHMNSGMLVLEGIYRGINEVRGIEHRIGGSSGSGLWDESGRERPRGMGMSTGLGEGCERADRECDVSGIKCTGKHTDSSSALSAEAAGIDEMGGVSREGSTQAGTIVRDCSCDVD